MNKFVPVLLVLICAVVGYRFWSPNLRKSVFDPDLNRGRGSAVLAMAAILSAVVYACIVLLWPIILPGVPNFPQNSVLTFVVPFVLLSYIFFRKLKVK